MELGIVISVISVLLTTVVVSTTGMFRSARVYRTGGEMNQMARAAADALRRNLRIDPGGPSFLFFADGVNPRPLTATTPACYDLSRFPGSTRICQTTNQVGPIWQSPYAPVQPVPAGSPLLALLGGNKVYSNGFNVWCMPYAVCLYPFRAEVLTCVPQDDTNGPAFAGAQPCGVCPTASPVTNERTSCLVISVPLTHRGIASPKYSYQDWLLDMDPPTGADRSPMN